MPHWHHRFANHLCDPEQSPSYSTLLQSPCPRNPPHPHATPLFWNAFLRASLRTLGYLETARARTTIWVGHSSMNGGPMWTPIPISPFGTLSDPLSHGYSWPDALRSSRSYAYGAVLRPPDEQMASTGWHVLFLMDHPKFGCQMVPICWF